MNDLHGTHRVSKISGKVVGYEGSADTGWAVTLETDEGERVTVKVPPRRGRMPVAFPETEALKERRCRAVADDGLDGLNHRPRKS